MAGVGDLLGMQDRVEVYLTKLFDGFFRGVQCCEGTFGVCTESKETLLRGMGRDCQLAMDSTYSSMRGTFGRQFLQST